jgi:uncharacterized peroxidase-related enzyme
MTRKSRLTALDLGPDDRLEPEIEAYFAKCEEKLGFVPNVLRAYAFDNAKLKAFILMSDDLMLGDSGLSKAEREMIAVAVSSVNHCHYCLTAHGARAPARQGPEMGELIAQNYGPPSLPPRQRAMLDFAADAHRGAGQDRGGGPPGLAPGRFLRSRHLGHRRRRRLLQHVEPHAAAVDMRPNREYHYGARARRAATWPEAASRRPARRRGKDS